VELCPGDTLLCTNGSRRFYVSKRDVANKPLEPLAEATCCGREMIKIGEAKEYEIVPLFECSVCMDIMLSNGEKLVNKVSEPVYNYPVEEEDELVMVTSSLLDEAMVQPTSTIANTYEEYINMRTARVTSTRPRS